MVSALDPNSPRLVAAQWPPGARNQDGAPDASPQNPPSTSLPVRRPAGRPTRERRGHDPRGYRTAAAALPGDLGSGV